MRVQPVNHKDILVKHEKRLFTGRHAMNEKKKRHVKKVLSEYLSFVRENVLKGEEVELNILKTKAFGVIGIDKKLFSEVNKRLHRYFHISTKRLGLLYRINIFNSKPINKNGYYFVSNKRLHEDMVSVLSETDLIYKL